MSAEPGSLGILALEGDIDLYHSAVVKERLNELIEQKLDRILVNLSEVTYMDSSGLAVLIECLQRIGAYGGKFGLFGPRETVRHIFEVARLDQVFRLFPDEATARASL